MKFMIEQKIVNLSKSSIGLPLTKPMRQLGWKSGDNVRVSVPDDHIKIEKIEDSKK